MVQRKARRNHHRQTSSRPGQGQCSFDKQLIEICVPVTLPSVCARLAGEGGECGVAGCSCAAKYFPWRVSDNRVKAGRGAGASLVMEDLGKLELPVKEPFSGCDGLCAIQERL